MFFFVLVNVVEKSHCLVVYTQSQVERQSHVEEKMKKRVHEQLISTEVVETDGRRVERRKYKQITDLGNPDQEEEEEDFFPQDKLSDTSSQSMDQGPAFVQEGQGILGGLMIAAPMPETNVVFDQIVREQVRPEIECWGCKVDFGKSREKGAYIGAHEMFQAYHEKKDKMQPYALAEELGKVHEKYVFKACQAAGISCIEWPVETIHIHLTGGHMGGMKHMIEETIHELDRFRRGLRDHLFQTDATGKRIVHTENKRAYLEFVKQQASMIDRYKLHC